MLAIRQLLDTDAHGRPSRRCIVATICFAILAIPAVGRSDVLFVGNTGCCSDPGSDEIGEYTTSGTTVNASLITGLNDTFSIAVSGSNLFVSNSVSGTIGEYTTSGATVNASLITGLNDPAGIVVAGSNLFVASRITFGGNPTGTGTIGEYTTSGTTVNAGRIRHGSSDTSYHGPETGVAGSTGRHWGRKTPSPACSNHTWTGSPMRRQSGGHSEIPPTIRSPGSSASSTKTTG